MKQPWFFLGLFFCGPLGLIGWLARRRDWLGLIAALVVLTGAVVEAFVTGRINPLEIMPWPQYYALLVCGVFLVCAGACGFIWVLWNQRKAMARCVQEWVKGTF